SRLRHALYFSFTRGFVFCGAIGVDYGECDLPLLGRSEGNSLCSTANLNQIPSEMIKGASHVLNGVASDQRDGRCHRPDMSQWRTPIQSPAMATAFLNQHLEGRSQRFVFEIPCNRIVVRRQRLNSLFLIMNGPLIG